MKGIVMKSTPPSREDDLEAGYREMAKDEAREIEALDLAEASVGDVGDEAR
jgi:hypothetical protein